MIRGTGRCAVLQQGCTAAACSERAFISPCTPELAPEGASSAARTLCASRPPPAARCRPAPRSAAVSVVTAPPLRSFVCSAALAGGQELPQAGAPRRGRLCPCCQRRRGPRRGAAWLRPGLPERPRGERRREAGHAVVAAELEGIRRQRAMAALPAAWCQQCSAVQGNAGSAGNSMPAVAAVPARPAAPGWVRPLGLAAPPAPCICQVEPARIAKRAPQLHEQSLLVTFQSL